MCADALCGSRRVRASRSALAPFLAPRGPREEGLTMALSINDTKDIARGDGPADLASPQAAPWADRFIRLTKALVVATVAAIAAVISYRHAYELVSDHGETGLTARLVSLTVDGLIVAASMRIL